MNKFAVFSVFLTTTALCTLAEVTDTTDVVVTTTAGQIQGTNDGTVSTFRGIPYAEPPIDSLRWQDPIAKKAWHDTLPTTKDGPGCPQVCKLPAIACPPVQDESCLFLNVFTPAVPSKEASSDDSSKAVLFWIHGGDFYQGFGGGLLYDGHAIAREQDVVVVALNYRLGALGFLYSGPDKTHNFTGNYGLLDQQLALKWVQQNIAQFNGDPQRVTIFGQSAGGASVASLLNMESSKNLFTRAILQSNPAGLPFRTTDKYPAFTKFVAKDAGCISTPNEPSYEKCMRSLSWQNVLAAAVTAETNLLIEVDLGNFLSLFQPFSPVVGPTSQLKVQPMVGFLAGTSLDVPVIMGSVKQEGVIFVYEAFKKALPKLEEDALFSVIYGVKNLAKVLQQYPRNMTSSKKDLRNHTAPVVTDSLFHCPVRHVSKKLAQLQANGTRKNGLVFSYHFDHVLSFGNKFWLPSAPICVDTVCHGEELPLLFQPNLAQINGSYSPEENTLSKSMHRFWSNFAKNGTPGSEWPQFDDQNEAAIRLETPSSTMESKSYYHKCQLWDDIGYEWVLRHSF